MSATIIPVFGGPVPEGLRDYLARVGEATVTDVAARFLWSEAEARLALRRLVERGEATRASRAETGRWRGHRRHVYAPGTDPSASR